MIKIGETWYRKVSKDSDCKPCAFKKGSKECALLGCSGQSSYREVHKHRGKMISLFPSAWNRCTGCTELGGPGVCHAVGHDDLLCGCREVFKEVFIPENLEI